MFVDWMTSGFPSSSFLANLRKALELVGDQRNVGKTVPRKNLRYVTLVNNGMRKKLTAQHGVANLDTEKNCPRPSWHKGVRQDVIPGPPIISDDADRS